MDDALRRHEPGALADVDDHQPARQRRSGRFDVVDGALVARPGSDIGLYWYTQPSPADFELALEFRQGTLADNSGVFVRFPDLDSKGYNNTAYVAVDYGFEIQIDGLGAPDGAPKHMTGAIYNTDDQAFSLVAARPAGEWNEYVISAIGQVYTVALNGTQTTRFVNTNVMRGAPAPAFIGVQTHPGNGDVAFRNVPDPRALTATASDSCAPRASRSDPSWSGCPSTSRCSSTTIATSPRSKMRGSSPELACSETVDTLRSMTSATIGVACRRGRVMSCCSRSLSVRMPASLPLVEHRHLRDAVLLEEVASRGRPCR